MLGYFKRKSELRKSRDLVEQKSNELESKRMEAATKALQDVIEARNIVRDDDLAGGHWMLSGIAGGTLTGDPDYDHLKMLEKVYNMYHTNVHARAIIRGLVKFTLGIGPQVESIESKDALKKKINDTWDSFKKRNKFNVREKEIATRLFRDGEVFLRLFTDKLTGEVDTRFIRSSLIRTPIDRFRDITNGIETDPNDIETPLYYYLCDHEGNFKEEIDAKEVIHMKIFSDSDQKRGISILAVCAKRLKQYDDWLEDRIILNKVRSAIALVRKVEGSKTTVQTVRDANLSTDLSETRKAQKLMKGGTVLTASKGIDYQLLSSNINAADAKDDGRAMQLSIAAGVGMPEMIFTADFSSANYGSSLIAQNPFVREIEEWQDFFSSFYEKLFEVIIKAKIDHGDLPENTNTGCRIDFPPMLRDELDKLATAYETLHKYKIVSRKTWRGKMGLNDECEKAYIEEEEGDSFNNYIPGGQPGLGAPGDRSRFNLPLSPVNQFGSQKMIEMINAMREKNWDKLIELAEDMEYGDHDEGLDMTNPITTDE